MDIVLSPLSTFQVKHLSLLETFGQKLKNYFQSKNYGNDLKEISIGVVVVEPRLQKFFKVKKPTYISKPTTYIRNTISRTMHRALYYKISLNFDRFNNIGEKEAEEMLKKELMNSVTQINGVKNRIRDFNLERFKNDLALFLEDKTSQRTDPVLDLHF